MSDLMGATMSRMAVMRMGVRSRLAGTSGERFRITDESAPCALVQDSQPDSLRDTLDHPCLSACRAVLSACLRGAAVVGAKARCFEPRRRAADGDARQLRFVLAPKVETAAATVCPPITSRGLASVHPLARIQFTGHRRFASSCTAFGNHGGVAWPRGWRGVLAAPSLLALRLDPPPRPARGPPGAEPALQVGDRLEAHVLRCRGGERGAPAAGAEEEEALVLRENRLVI